MSTLTSDPLLFEELFALPAEEQARILAEETEPVTFARACCWCSMYRPGQVANTIRVKAEGSDGACPSCVATMRAALAAKKASR